ncbi:MAG: type IX secretion system outer membrane channel protein PorV [Cyclobacteriaceae bacterium]|nr:type IX secretion system outer membrane channel protein PorV [Cyclobacteriaceae bacterium]
MIKYLRFKHIIAIPLIVLIADFSHGQGTAIIAGQDTSRRVITTAVPFLTISPDARAGAMGDVGVATSPDASSGHWNPAKFAFVENDYGFSLSYTPWLGKIINDMSISYLGGYYKINRERAIAVSMRYFDLGDITYTNIFGDPTGQFNPREFSIDGTYSQLLTEYFSIGVSLRYIHSNLTGNVFNSTSDAQAGTSVAADIGIFFDKDILLSGKNSNVSAGLSITNIGQKMTYSNDDNKEFIPTNIRLGTSFTTSLDPYNRLSFILDFNKLMVPTPPVYAVDENGAIIYDDEGNPVIKRGKDPDRSLISGMFGSFADAPDGFSEEMQEIMIAGGMEYWYRDLFSARAGYFYENQNKGNRKYFTMGLGFRYRVFGVDFAYLVPQDSNHPLAETLRFTLMFNFNTYKQQESITDDEAN